MLVDTERPSQPISAADLDPGVETLDRMASVDRYNRWVYGSVQRHVGRRILEVGCGLGNMTPYFLGRDLLVSLDLLSASVARVSERFADEPGFEALRGDICARATVESLVGRRFDTVVCLNVLEHIADDRLALDHMGELLTPDGRLILLVPAGPFLYGTLDRAIGHHRRYEASALAELLRSSRLTVHQIDHFNVFGIPGWFLASRVLRRRVPPRGLLRAFNLLTPLFIRFERIFRPSIGQSIVCIAAPA